MTNRRPSTTARRRPLVDEDARRPSLLIRHRPSADFIPRTSYDPDRPTFDFYTRSASIANRVGVANRDVIADSQMTSSTHCADDTRAHFGRLGSTRNGGAPWMAAMYDADGRAISAAGQWLQVDLGKGKLLYGIITAGGFQSNYAPHRRFCKSFKIMYGWEADGHFDTFKDENGEDKIFEGNEDHSTEITNWFRPIAARFVRFVVAGSDPGDPAVKLEFLVLPTRNRPVGVADPNVIRDEQMTASSYFDERFLPCFGRIDNSKGNMASWMAKVKQQGEYLQVDFGEPLRLAGIVTQGGAGGRVTKTFKVGLAITLDKFEIIKDTNGKDRIFSGSLDGQKITNLWSTPHFGRYARYIVGPEPGDAAVKLEFIMC